CIVEADVKQDLDEIIGQSIEKELRFGVINSTATAHEAAAKHTVVPLIEFLPVPHNVTGIVRFVTHHNYGGIACHVGEAAGDRAPESAWRRIFHGPQGGNAAPGSVERRPGLIGAAIVHDNDFMWDIVEPQFYIEMLDCRCNAVLFILRWDNDREQLQRWLCELNTTHMQPDISSHSGCASACWAISSRICSIASVGCQSH